MSEAEMWIEDGGIVIPEDAEPAVGSWTCPNDGFTMETFTESAFIVMMWVQCPYCGTSAEIVPLLRPPA